MAGGPPCLAVGRSGLCYASHCSCKEKQLFPPPPPERPSPVPNGCDQQPQDPNCHSLLEIMRRRRQKPRVKATSHKTKGYYQHILPVSAKGTSTGGSLLRLTHGESVVLQKGFLRMGQPKVQTIRTCLWKRLS